MSARKLYATDDSFREVADLLFGGGYEEVVAKASSDADEIKRKIGFATNMAGAIAGPAALWQADKARRSGKGGVPRDLARAVVGEGKHKKLGRVRSTTLKGIQALDTPKGRAGKIAAGVAGGSIVGLQAANWAGDAIAAQHLSSQKKKKEPVGKGYISKMNPEGHDLSAKGVKIPSKREVAVATGQKLEPHIRVQGGKLKKLAQEKVGKSEAYDVTWEGEFSKVNSDKQQVFGWASIVEINGEPVVDLQGDYISIDEVEKSAYEYVHKSRKGGDMHLRDGEEPVHASDMIESFVVTPEKKKALNLPDETPTGWWVGFQVNDPEVWAKVKSGERTGFSIHGRGVRSPM